MEDFYQSISSQATLGSSHKESDRGKKLPKLKISNLEPFNEQKSRKGLNKYSSMQDLNPCKINIDSLAASVSSNASQDSKNEYFKKFKGIPKIRNSRNFKNLDEYSLKKESSYGPVSKDFHLISQIEIFSSLNQFSRRGNKLFNHQKLLAIKNGINYTLR